MRYAIYAPGRCRGSAAPAEDSGQVLDAYHVHGELSLPAGFCALGFSSQYSVQLKKKKEGGKGILLNILSFRLSSWKGRAKYPSWTLLATKATPVFSFYPPRPSLSGARSPEPVSRSGAAELEKDWNECYSTHTVSRTHARTPTPPTSKHVRARTRTPPPSPSPTLSHA